MFSRIAPTYDRANRFISLSRDRAWREACIELMIRDGFVPTRVLDLCAGTGDFALALKRRFPDAKVVLSDLSKPMLDVARGKLEGIPDVSYRTADAHKTPFPRGSFDSLLCGFGLRNLDHKVRGLKEMARVLKRGGRVCILEFLRPAGPLAGLFFRGIVKRVVPALGGRVSGDPEAYRYLIDSASRTLSADEAVRLMRDAGFADVRVKTFMFGMVTALVGERR
jgi:demethylmenaquinone methyltransferase/2-methoxy-6-polyprenyl-1,4-benzoquinol methylase